MVVTQRKSLFSCFLPVPELPFPGAFSIIRFLHLLLDIVFGYISIYAFLFL